MMFYVYLIVKGIYNSVKITKNCIIDFDTSRCEKKNIVKTEFEKTNNLLSYC